jgi:hypothetical protein
VYFVNTFNCFVNVEFEFVFDVEFDEVDDRELDSDGEERAILDCELVLKFVLELDDSNFDDCNDFEFEVDIGCDLFVAEEEESDNLLCDVCVEHLIGFELDDDLVDVDDVFDISFVFVLFVSIVDVPHIFDACSMVRSLGTTMVNNSFFDVNCAHDCKKVRTLFRYVSFFYTK